MELEAKIKIDDYLSQEEKKQIAIDVFSKRLKNELFKSNECTVQSDSEIQRIIGNISHKIVMNEMEKFIPNCENMIKDKVKKILKGDLTYKIFQKSNGWGDKDSLAIQYIKEATQENELYFKNRIKKEMANYDLKDVLSQQVSNSFGDMADTIYKLSDLFNPKQR